MKNKMNLIESTEYLRSEANIPIGGSIAACCIEILRIYNERVSPWDEVFFQIDSKLTKFEILNTTPAGMGERTITEEEANEAYLVDSIIVATANFIKNKTKEASEK